MQPSRYPLAISPAGNPDFNRYMIESSTKSSTNGGCKKNMIKHVCSEMFWKSLFYLPHTMMICMNNHQQIEKKNGTNLGPNAGVWSSFQPWPRLWPDPRIGISDNLGWWSIRNIKRWSRPIDSLLKYILKTTRSMMSQALPPGIRISSCIFTVSELHCHCPTWHRRNSGIVSLPNHHADSPECSSHFHGFNLKYSSHSSSLVVPADPKVVYSDGHQT